MARKNYEESQIKEELELALLEWNTIKNTTTKEITFEDFLNSKFNNTIKNEDGTYTVLINGYSFTVEADGKIQQTDTKEENENQYIEGLKYAYNMKLSPSNNVIYGASFSNSSYLETDNIGESYMGTSSKTLMAWFRTCANEWSISGFVRNRC